MKQQFAAKHPWTILAAGAAIQVLTGLPAAWGVFQQPVMEEYGLSEQGAGYAFALLIAAFGVGCVLGGFLQDKKGPRCAALWGTALLCGGFFAAAFLPGWAGWGFFLAFSIPAGLGTAFLYPSIQSCAQKWYAGRKGLATGVIGGAVGLSGAFLTLFVRAALRGFGPVQGIRGAFWAARGWWVVVCYAGLTFCYSALAAVLPALSTDLFGLPHAGVNYGFLALGQSVGSLAFPFAANLLALENGRHLLAMAGAAAGFAAIWALHPVQKDPR